MLCECRPAAPAIGQRSIGHHAGTFCKPQDLSNDFNVWHLYSTAYPPLSKHSRSRQPLYASHLQFRTYSNDRI